MDKSPNTLSQEQQEEFEKFLLEAMDKKEKEAFLLKLGNDQILKERFQEFSMFFAVIEEEGLRKKMEVFHEKIPKAATTKKSLFPVYGIAAGILVMVALGLWFLNRPGTNEKLFEAYFTPDPGLPTVMGSSDNYAFYEAMVDYKQGNYGLAISKWEQLDINQSKKDTLNYYLGMAYLVEENLESATKKFEASLQTDSKALKDKSYFYLGLCYLKEGDYQNSIFYLKKSGDQKSKALLERLQNTTLK